MIVLLSLKCYVWYDYKYNYKNVVNFLWLEIKIRSVLLVVLVYGMLVVNILENVFIVINFLGNLSY